MRAPSFVTLALGLAFLHPYLLNYLVNGCGEGGAVDVPEGLESFLDAKIICLVVPPTPSTEKFIAIRRLCGRPVTVVYGETDYERFVLRPSIRECPTPVSCSIA